MWPIGVKNLKKKSERRKKVSGLAAGGTPLALFIGFIGLRVIFTGLQLATEGVLAS